MIFQIDAAVATSSPIPLLKIRNILPRLSHIARLSPAILKSMSAQSPPLIIGAGPVGLAAALFLARQDIPFRIIDSADKIDPHSRALAVNPRTLDILQSTGITEQMLSLGKPIHGVHFHIGSHLAGAITFQSLHHRYPFLLALSQAATTRLLEQALQKSGVNVEWSTQLIHCKHDAEGVEAGVRASLYGPVQMLHCPWLLAADGARSAVREALNIEFAGTTFENPWHLLDIPLSTSIPDDFAHVHFLPDGGFLFMIRVIEDSTHASHGDPLWRIMGNIPNLIDRLEGAQPTGPPVWNSTFHIAHRINQRLSAGDVYFAGDAAHVHSPIGARGMNLGIEDAWVFSQMLIRGELADYGAQRYKVDRRVVKRIELLSRLARGESAGSRTLRSVLPAIAHVPLMRSRMLTMLTGLDHPLPFASATYPSRPSPASSFVASRPLSR
jgi:2-polyprenyl-6-methoxyphenol hydroxylase-like FAD-dependent oxidoreductase